MKTFVVQFKKNARAGSKKTQNEYLPDFEYFFNTDNLDFPLTRQPFKSLREEFPFYCGYIEATILAAQRMNKIAEERSLRLVTAYTVDDGSLFGFIYHLEVCGEVECVW